NWQTVSQMHGFGIFPGRTSGATYKFDWLQLTPAANTCSTFAVTYATDAFDEVYTLFVDDNNDPTDGFQEKIGPLRGTGANQTRNLNTSKFYPDRYRILAIAHDDFFTNQLAPINFSSPGSINTDTTNDISNLTRTGGKLVFNATGNDPHFFLEMPLSQTVDSSVFDKMSIKAENLGGDSIRVFFYNTSQVLLGSAAANVTTDNEVVDIDLGSVGAYSGQIGLFRIDTGTAPANNIAIDWIHLGTAFSNTEPAIPTVQSSPGIITISERGLAPFVQPDNEGGVSFPSENGNIIDFANSADVQNTANLSSLTLYPGSSFTDSGGNVHTTSFAKGVNDASKDPGDPYFDFYFVDTGIDPTEYHIICASVTSPELDPSDFHTNFRYSWSTGTPENPTSYTSDDLILKTTGLGRHCVDLINLPIEVGSETVNGNFWTGQINSLGVHPAELEEVTPFIVSDVTFTSSHKANDQYAIVVGGSRDKEVKVYRTTSKSASGGTLVGTLAADRNTDVLLWNSSAHNNGSVWYLYSEVDGNNYLSEGPVQIDRDFDDSELPILFLDAPSSSGNNRYSTLDVTGYAVDNVRISTIEVFIDNALVLGFMPDLYHVDAKDLYPNYPRSSRAGFQKSIDLSDYIDGSHVVKVVAYDTAGNSKTISRSFTKASSNLADPVELEVPNETPITIDTLSQSEALTMDVTSSKSTLSIKIRNARAGRAHELSFGPNKKKARNQSSGVFTFTPTSSTVTISFDSTTPGIKVKKGLVGKQKKNARKVFAHVKVPSLNSVSDLTKPFNVKAGFKPPKGTNPNKLSKQSWTSTVLDHISASSN
ncbi:MAG: hypothetical protein KDD56_07280, partial [Bdellovibrionales bacterium]|nr:hypothetical protein [Bdellovibrionales bacterium]